MIAAIDFKDQFIQLYNLWNIVNIYLKFVHNYMAMIESRDQHEN